MFLKKTCVDTPPWLYVFVCSRHFDFLCRCRYGVGYTLTIAKTVGCDADKVASIVGASIRGAEVPEPQVLSPWLRR